MADKKLNTSIFIFTRDLRLDDNTGLIKACLLSHTVIPIFIFNPQQIDSSNSYKSNFCVQFMIQSIDSLKKQLKNHSSDLFLFYGDIEKILKSILKKKDIDAIFINKDYTPFAKSREKELDKFCTANKLEFYCLEDHMLVGVEDCLKDDHTPYVKFTSYYRQAKKQQIRKFVQNKHTNYLHKSGLKIKSVKVDKFYTPNPNALVEGGRENGLKMLAASKNQKNYSKSREMVAQSTTHLSAYLKFGCISVRETYEYFSKHLQSTNTLFDQLHWRDFYMQIMYYFPHVIGSNMNHKKIVWENDSHKIKMWKIGTTGYPIVDAGMREMNHTGYMHNRCRMIVANFLIKILHVDWKIGEKYFAQQLVDYDPANNNGGWQWSASTGTDSQPYFRYFSPIRQAIRYDPDCEYIKKWIPELKDVPNKIIHKWDEYAAQYRETGYPEPIVADITKEIKKTFKMYGR